MESPSLTEEDAAFREVAETISRFVTRQSELRANPGATGARAGEVDRIRNDLPRTSADGKGLSTEAHDRYATRDVHRKTHGCFAASLEVRSDIQSQLNRTIQKFIEERAGEGVGAAPELIQDLSQVGVFQPGARYDAVVRYSNGHPGNRPDREPDARGMALKILPAGTLSASIPRPDASIVNPATLLDILTINFPTFFVNDPRKYLAINQWFLKGSEDFRGPVSAFVYQTGAVFPKWINGLTPLEQKLALMSNGSIPYSPLYQKYFSMVPSRLGHFGEARAVKYAFVPEPCDPSIAKAFDYEAAGQWADWTRRRDFALVSRTPWAKHFSPPFEANYGPDYLRQNLMSRLRTGDACFSLRFQLYRDQISTNIEDSTDVWLADENARAEWQAMMRQGSNLDQSYYDQIAAKKLSPEISVAFLRIHSIGRDFPTGNTKTCEDLSFNPWNGRVDLHQPLGVVSRMKRRVYNASRRTRHGINELPARDWERAGR